MIGLCPTATRMLRTWTETDRQVFLGMRLRVHGNQIEAWDEWRQRLTRERYIPAKSREQILQWPCRYCDGDSVVVDHYIPVSRGGLGVRANLVPACYLCNQDKADLFMDEWRARRERLGCPWPPPNSTTIRTRLLHPLRSLIQQAIEQGLLPPKLPLEFWEVFWSFQRKIYNGNDAWDEATAALTAHLQARVRGSSSSISPHHPSTQTSTPTPGPTVTSRPTPAHPEAGVVTV